MSTKLQELVNKHIKRAQKVHDYFQLYFVDGTILNIFNSYSIIDGSDMDLSGYEIVAVNSDVNTVNLVLSPQGTIQVGMKDSDYRGPEAMEYIATNGAYVVWQ